MIKKDREKVGNEKFSISINFLSTVEETDERSLRCLIARRGKIPMGIKNVPEKRFFPIWCVWYTRARNTIPESGSNVLPRGNGRRAIILQYPLRSHRNVERIKMRQKR